MTSRKGRFLWKQGDIEISQCAACAHYVSDGKCAAFLAGIPDAILRNDVDHTLPYPGDNGIQFEPLETADE